MIPGFPRVKADNIMGGEAGTKNGVIRRLALGCNFVHYNGFRGIPGLRVREFSLMSQGDTAGVAVLFRTTQRFLPRCADRFIQKHIHRADDHGAQPQGFGARHIFSMAIPAFISD